MVMLNWNMSTATNTPTVVFTPPPKKPSKEKKRIISLDGKTLQNCTHPEAHPNPKP
jgi:hypothetical protein